VRGGGGVERVEEGAGAEEGGGVGEELKDTPF